ncbi:hypothetical protein [Adhaeribacter arboris]|uniref:hypothetical protein n=1 Tax=Adhaeribacter arboris TaxID=2072846 RepID=UPI001304C4B6|nr:hypothetical protein [Adhaeribacter arboris]
MEYGLFKNTDDYLMVTVARHTFLFRKAYRLPLPAAFCVAVFFISAKIARN